MSRWRGAAGAHAHHARKFSGALQQPELCGLGQLRGGRLQLEGYAMTLSAFAWNIVRTYTLTPGRRYSIGCRYRLGTASNLVMYVSAADNDYVGVTGTFLGTPSQGVWSTARLDFSVPPGGIAKLHFGAFGGSIPGLVQQSAGTLDLYSMQIRASAFEGESVSVTDLLADSLALTGLATLDGLTAQGNVGCDQLLCKRVHHGRGRLGRSLLRCPHSHRHRRRGRAVVHGGRVRQLAEHQRELTGDDGNFVVTTDLGNEFATLDRELPAEAVHRTKRPEDRNAIAVVDRGIQTLKKDLATRVARKGGQWSDHFERAAGAYNARPHETVHGAPEDVEKQPATEFRVLQDNADKFQHNKDLTDRRVKAVQGAFRAPTNAARSFNPQYGDVQRLGAVDSMTVRSTEGRETLLKLALPAPQGSGNAAGRLTRRRPAAVRQLDDFLAPPRPRTLD